MMSTSDMNRMNHQHDDNGNDNKAMKDKAKAERDAAARMATSRMSDNSMGDSTGEILDVVRQRLSNDNTIMLPPTTTISTTTASLSNNNNTSTPTNKKSTMITSKQQQQQQPNSSNSTAANDAVDHRLRILESLVIVDEENDEDCDPVERKLAAASTTRPTARCSSRRRSEASSAASSDSGDDGSSVLLVGTNSLSHLKRAANSYRQEEATMPPQTQLHQCQSKQNPTTTTTTTKPPPPCMPGAHRVRGLNNLRSSLCNSIRYSMGSSSTGSDSAPHPDDSLIDHPHSFKPTKRPSKDESVRTSVTAVEEFHQEGEEDDDLDALFNGLAVANPVDEDEDYDCENLPHAQGICKEQEEAKRRRKARRRNWAMLIGVPLVFVAGVVLIVTLVLATRGRDQQEEGFAAASSGTGSEIVVSLTPEAYVLSLLPDETLRVLVDEPGSPQAKALEWLLQDLDSNPLIEDERILQRYALATLYYSTRGDHWLANDDWLSHTHHECDWYNQQDFKMKCTLWNHYSHGNNLAHFFPQFVPEAATTRCNPNTGLYENLWLDANNLVGEIPEEIYLLLPTLKTISFVNNKLVGPLSSNIGHLSNLEGFFSFGMKQGGQIPSQIGLLTNLRGLGLLSNEHTGTIPSEFWSLTSLETSALGGNTELHGTFPSDIGSLTNLKWFCVFRGRLTGTLPTEVGLLSNLEMLDMEGNHLVGPIPSQIGSLKKMAMMSLHNSAVTGTIPPELGSMGSTVNLLNLGGNDLTGTIPTQLASLVSLEFLDISENQNLASSSIPTQIELLPNLETLNI